MAYSNRWKTDPENTELLNYLINKTKYVKPPINIYEIIRDFKEKSGAVQTIGCLQKRIKKMSEIIHTFEHIETDAKVRMLFVLSVPVNRDFLQELSNDAHVEVDGKNRITHYKSKSLKLKGYHMLPTAKNYWTTDPEYIDLVNYLIEETENVKSPMNLLQLARGFKEMSGAAQTVKGLNSRILKVRTKIHSFEHLDKNTKVKLIFALSAPVDFLKELKKDAIVEVDDEKRINYYKSNDGSLELGGDHRRSVKISTGKQKSKQSYRSLIETYFENKNNADAVSKNKREGEMWNLIEFITEKCENVNSPLNITRMAKDFNNHFGISEAIYSIRHRIRGYSREIQTSNYLSTPTKVRQLFSLGATVDSDYLEKLRENALVEVDDKKRITYYKANDGSLELKGDQSRLAKSKRSHRSLIRDYFENKNDSDAVPKTEIQKEIKNLIEFIIEKCEQVNSPLSIHQFTKDFNKSVGLSQSLDCIHKRIEAYCREIQTLECLDTHTKVKQLFSLSAKVSSDYLEKLRKDAHVEVDEKERISHYKAKNGSLELTGDHSRSAKNKIAQFESKRSIRSMIIDYFKNKNNADAVPENDEEKEMWNLIEFITDMCENVDTPLNIFQLTKDLYKLFGLSRTLGCIKKRTKEYCHEIQEAEFLDTPSKVKQLFGLSAKLNSDSLKELRKTAFVEVDHENRIIKYTANDGSLTLRGSHCRPKKTLSRRVKKTDKGSTAMSDDSEEESDNDGLDDSSDEYSSEEFGSEFDSDDDNDSQDEPEDLVERSNKADYFDNNSSMINNSPSEVSIDNQFGFDPLTEKSHKSEEPKFKEDEENDSEITENAKIKTRSGRLSKKRHLDSEFGSSEATINKAADHRLLVKNRTAKLKTKRGLRSLMDVYFKNKNVADTFLKNKRQKEMWNLIKFITGKCDKINSPLSMHQLAKEFNKHVGLSQSLDCIRGRIRAYRREIQRTEFLDIQTKSKQLFVLNIKLDSDCLRELRKIALVEVDHENRIIEYTSNDGSLSLQGSHWRSKKALSRCVEKTDKDNVAAMPNNSEKESDQEGLDDSSSSAKNKSGWILRRKSKKNVTKNSNSDGDKSEESEIEDGYSDDDSDEYPSEEFGSESDSDNETDSMNEPEDLVGRSNEASNFYCESSMRNRSPSGMSIEDKFGFDQSEETGIREDKENDTEKTENAVIKTRSGRLSKKRHLDSEFSYDLASFGSSKATMNTNPTPSKPAKQKKIVIQKEEAASSSNQSRNSALLSISTGENRDDQDAPDYSIDDQVKLEPFRGEIQEDLKGIVDDKDIQQIPKPMETPIKVEVEEPVEVKPETSHNSKTQLFEAMQSLILCLDTPSLSEIQSKIHQMIQKLEERDDVMLNNEISVIIDSLISRMSNTSVVHLSNNVESVNLSNLLCYLKASILNSKMIGVGGLVQNISKLIEESQNKRIPMEKVANALRATLDIDNF